MKKKKTGKLFSNQELSAFCGQLALVLKSGLSSYEGISIMLEDTGLKEEKEILKSIQESLSCGNSLSYAFQELELFPSYLIQMVKIGEETGKLDDVMVLLSAHYDREDFISQSLRNALTYPLVMAGMMLVVIVVLLVKVLPVFNQVFIQLGSEMTGLSRVLMEIGQVLNHYSILFVTLFVLLTGFLLFASRTNKGRVIFLRLCCRLPFTRVLFEETAACRFSSAMALTLGSGISPEQSLDMVLALIEDEAFQKKLKECQAYVSNGEELAKALHHSHIFSGMYSRMISIGEKTGSMEKSMENVADRYQDSIDFRISRTLAVIEPTLVISISLMVGIILFSVMLPLIGIMSGI